MNWVPVITAIATVAGALGIAYAVFTSARVQSTITLYKEENTAQGKRITTLENDNRLALEKLEALRRENDMLRDLATGRTVMEALGADLKNQEEKRAMEHQAMMVLLREMHEQLVELWRGLTRYLGDGGKA